MSTGDAHQIAYKHILPNLRRNIATNYMKKILEHTKLRQDPIHRQILKTKRKLQEDDDYESEEAMKYAVKKRKYLISKATGTLWWWRWRKWMNLNPWKNEQIEPWKWRTYHSGEHINDLSPHFLPIMDDKMGQYPPKMGKMGNIPPDRGKNRGIRNFYSIFIYNFGHFFVICPSPRNGGIAKDS